MFLRCNVLEDPFVKTCTLTSPLFDPCLALLDNRRNLNPFQARLDIRRPNPYTTLVSPLFTLTCIFGGGDPKYPKHDF